MFRIIVTTEHEIQLGGHYMKKRGRPPKQVETDPLTRAKELLKKFKAEADAAILSVNTALGRRAHDSAVGEAIAVCRRSYAFGHALSQITGKSIYRVSGKPLRELKIQARSILLSPTPLPDEAIAVLEELKTTMPLPKIFEGEAEYQRWLKVRGMVEIVEDKDDYRSQTARQKFPSVD